MWSRGKIFMPNMLIKSLLMGALLVGGAQAEEQTKAEVEKPAIEPAPAEVEINRLTLFVRTVYPEDVETVGDAAQYLLDASGYLLVTDYPASRSAQKIAQRKVPPIAKVHRTMPLVDALQLLIGEGNWVVVDHVNRLVSFTEEKS